jgi:hypothetical protein
LICLSLKTKKKERRAKLLLISLVLSAGAANKNKQIALNRVHQASWVPGAPNPRLRQMLVVVVLMPIAQDRDS